MSPARRPLPGLAAVALLLLLALLAWDASGLDVALARHAGNEHGFPLRDHWLLAGPLHEGARRAAWGLALALALCGAVWWPVGPLAVLPPGRRLQLAVTTVAAALLVASLKAFSLTSCPWDLEGFGGAARHLSHWSLQADGGGGRCFPAGHASSGFAFVGGYFAFRGARPLLARAWLAAAVVAGLAFGLVQQWRGAHFMSHTLWTGWICWCTACVLDRIDWERRGCAA